MPKNFAMTGVAGYIAPRHLKAIKETGNRLVAAIDPNDAVGILDQYAFDVRFFTEFERFDRHLEKLRRGPAEQRVHYLSICAPNYLHDAHCRAALRIGADAICEKPLVINPWNLDPLQELEQESGKRIYTILQLRLHPRLIALREQLQQAPRGHRHDVVLTYITARGFWYHISWKGISEKSGGIATNIGIHFFDLLIWLFGDVLEQRVHHNDPQRMGGILELERARVRWFLSVDHRDLPFTAQAGSKTTYRSITIDEQEVEFTAGFTDLHTRVYEDILAGGGFGIDEVRPSIELVHQLRNAPIVTDEPPLRHPLLP
ncbi:Gfo/Idh/MocA family oxidoreductase [Candidatus Chloroploca asiatica]|uniref:Oxidoreductase n=1 Tax=Candidatus Chloroploca asiatica TaxID=1506545 RepID=A0A2H3KNV6_9CHLR|nr:Gfo/Idh/MocA family oxidoreductase [Candidatus Chloroploca asiatica]PDV99802.1 oxidoreductase [Candidatus Chloroploca asiatica]